MKYQVVNVTRYDFVPEGQKDRISGCKVNVLMPSVTEQNRKGCMVATMPAQYHVFDQFVELPGQYDLDVVHVPKGKTVEVHVLAAKKV